MSNKKKVKPSVDETAWETPEFPSGMGLFPEDIPFGRNVGCVGKSKDKPTQKPENQKNKD